MFFILFISRDFSMRTFVILNVSLYIALLASGVVLGFRLPNFYDLTRMDCPHRGQQTDPFPSAAMYGIQFSSSKDTFLHETSHDKIAATSIRVRVILHTLRAILFPRGNFEFRPWTQLLNDRNADMKQSQRWIWLSKPRIS